MWIEVLPRPTPYLELVEVNTALWALHFSESFAFGFTSEVAYWLWSLLWKQSLTITCDSKMKPLAGPMVIEGTYSRTKSQSATKSTGNRLNQSLKEREILNSKTQKTTQTKPRSYKVYKNWNSCFQHCSSVVYFDIMFNFGVRKRIVCCLKPSVSMQLGLTHLSFFFIYILFILSFPIFMHRE